MEDEASTSLISGRTPWPAGLRALEEQKEKEEEEGERVREATRQPQEQQQQQQQHQQEEQQQQQEQQTLEVQQQQQQQGEHQQQQEQEQQTLEGQQQQQGTARAPASRSGPTSTAGAARARRAGGRFASVRPSNPSVVLPGAPAAIRAEPGRPDSVVALACMMSTPADPESEIKRTI